MHDRTHFYVMAEKCDECLFTPNRIVPKDRVQEVLDRCEQSHFICHKASIAGGPLANTCCRGYYDREPHQTPAMRLAAMLDIVTFVPPEALK
jgi:hypothetical protein